MVAITHPAPRIAASRTVRREPAGVYRRRRLVVAALALLLLVALANLALTIAGAGEPAAPRPVAEVSVLVEPGDTVWSIAESLAGGGDVRPIVDALVAANGGAALQVGDRLALVLP